MEDVEIGASRPTPRLSLNSSFSPRDRSHQIEIFAIRHGKESLPTGQTRCERPERMRFCSYVFFFFSRSLSVLSTCSPSRGNAFIAPFLFTPLSHLELVDPELVGGEFGRSQERLVDGFAGSSGRGRRRLVVVFVEEKVEHRPPSSSSTPNSFFFLVSKQEADEAKEA